MCLFPRVSISPTGSRTVRHNLQILQYVDANPKSRNYPAAGGNYPKRKKEKGGEGEKKEKGARKKRGRFDLHYGTRRSKFEDAGYCTNYIDITCIIVLYYLKRTRQYSAGLYRISWDSLLVEQSPGSLFQTLLLCCSGN